MDPSGIRKIEDSDGVESKRDVKPQVKTLNRVPRMLLQLPHIQYLLIVLLIARGLCENPL